MFWVREVTVAYHCSYDACDFQTVAVPAVKESVMLNQMKIHLEDEHDVEFAWRDKPIRMVKL